jgi:hypothetical protein
MSNSCLARPQLGSIPHSTPTTDTAIIQVNPLESSSLSCLRSAQVRCLFAFILAVLNDPGSHTCRSSNLLPDVVLCGVGELIGWSGRLWSAYNVDASDPFMMQCVSQAAPGTRLCSLIYPIFRICATIISPTLLIAVNFILLSRIVEYLGACYSRISARWCALSLFRRKVYH